MNGVLEGGQFTSELQDITNTQRKQGEDIEQMKATLGMYIKICDSW